MAIHETLSGRVLEYDDPEPGGPLALFLKRVRASVDDPLVSESALIELVYGQGNPLLERDVITGRGAVTPRVFAEPLYHVLTDLIGRKRVALGHLDVEKAAAQFTMTVADAASKLGVHESAVRQAIDAFRLPAWKKSGKWFLDPRAVENFKPERRGPAPARPPTLPLEVRVGLRSGASLQVRGVDTSHLTKDGSGAWAGELKDWSKLYVLSKHGDKARLFVLEPGDETNEVVQGDLFVRGRFRFAEKVNAAKAARERWAELKGGE